MFDNMNLTLTINILIKQLSLSFISVNGGSPSVRESKACTDSQYRQSTPGPGAANTT